MIRNVAVVQPLPGIGDMVWHLPHIRAIAAWLGGPVTLITKPRSLADQLLAGDPAIRDILWVDRNPENRPGRHDGAAGFLRLVRLLRAPRFDTIIVLHHSHTIAAAAMLAGIPNRRGYGWGFQKWFLSRMPYLPGTVAALHPHERATRYLAAAGIPLASAEPVLQVSAEARAAVRARLPELPRPFIAMGIGSSEISRQFGAEKLAALGAALVNAGWPAIVLIGGPGDGTLAATIQSKLGPSAIPALGWHLSETAALLSEAAFYIGNNTGVMNMAAATGIRTYGLFGASRPFHHASRIVTIVSPPNGVDDGVARITVAQALAAIRADRGGLGIPEKEATAPMPPSQNGAGYIHPGNATPSPAARQGSQEPRGNRRDATA